MEIADADIKDIEVTIDGTIGAGGSNTLHTVNTLHYRRSTFVNPFLMSNFLTAFQATVQIPLLAAMNNRWTWNFTRGRVLNDATDIGEEEVVAVAGGVAGDGMTSINTVFMLFRTGKRGKSNRGGVHFGPLSEGDTTGAPVDILNAAAIVRWNAVATALFDTIVSADPNTFDLEVVSRKASQTEKNPTTVVGNQVSAIRLNKRIGRLKRREVASVY